MQGLARGALLVLALGIGMAIVVVGNAATALVLGEPIIGDGSFGMIDAPDVAVLHLIFTSLPLICLALVGSRSRLLWGLATGLTAMFWGYFALQIWLDSLTGFAGGANIGLGLIMMAAPFFTLACVGVAALIRRSRRPGG